jgi:hypothetical protein
MGYKGLGLRLVRAFSLVVGPSPFSYTVYGRESRSAERLQGTMLVSHATRVVVGIAVLLVALGLAAWKWRGSRAALGSLFLLFGDGIVYTPERPPMQEAQESKHRKGAQSGAPPR